MPRAQYSQAVDAPAQDLWAKLSDVEAWPRWLRVPYADGSVRLTDRAATPGSEVVLQGRRLPFRLFGRLVECEEARRLAIEIERSEYPSDRLFFRRARITVHLASVDDRRTRVNCAHEVEGKGPLGALYMASVFRPFLRANVRAIVRSLAEAVR